MGLKNKLNKMKSFLFDEVDDEKEIKKIPKISLKKENKKQEEEKEKEEELSKTQEIEELNFDDDIETDLEKTNEIKSRTQKNEKEFNFPEFDDDDFMVTTPKHTPVVKQEPKPVLYQGSKRKEEVKKFKPSPIISPIYGLLDMEGNRIQSDSASKEKNKYNSEVSLDVVRKKAYGNLDDNLEDTMKRLSQKTIEEAENDMEKEEKELSRTKNKEKKVALEKPIVVKQTDDEDDDDMILPNVNFKEIDVDKERAKDSKEKEISNVVEDDDDDTKEQDLFNLIDSMYQKEGKEE